MFNIYYSPQNVVVCPNRTYKKVNIDDVPIVIENCPSSSSAVDILTDNFQIRNVLVNDMLFITYFTYESREMSFHVFDILGNMKINKMQVSDQGENEIIMEKRKLSPGYYIIRMMDGSSVSEVMKFIVY